MRSSTASDSVWRGRAARLLLLLALCAVLALCWGVGRAHDAKSARTPAVPLTEAALTESLPRLAVTAADRSDDSAGAAALDLSRYDGECRIDEGGGYILSGRLDGTLRINAPEQTVHLFLDGVTITSPDGPAVRVDAADKVVVTLLPGTESTLSDSGDYRAAAELEACVFSVCDLTFNGTGALNVTGLYKDGLRSRDVLKILDGDIRVTCRRTGVHGTDGILVEGGTLTVSAEKYGFRTTKTGTDGRGSIVVAGGELTIIAGRYAFAASRGDLYIYGCTIHCRAVVDVYDVAGSVRIERGCIV